MDSDFYRDFEERFYAPRAQIKSLRFQYLSFILPLHTQYAGDKILDIGCGRGEWLEMMREIGFDAFGVDINDSMLRDCRERGLAVETTDGVGCLSRLDAESRVLISAFHVVEHLPFEHLVKVIVEALRVLKPGGLLMIETPNPENMVVATTNFYLDPTHLRPIPPPLLQFLTEYHGFARVKLLRLHERPELASCATPTLLDVLFGVSPDYAIIAQKDANIELMQHFDDAFNVKSGLTLEALGQQFEARLVKAEQAEATLAQIRKTWLWRFGRRVYKLIGRVLY